MRVRRAAAARRRAKGRTRRRPRGGPAQAGPRAGRTAGAGSDLGLGAFQRQIEVLYGRRDRARGLSETFMWFAEEVGELSRALRSTDRSSLSEEFADVLAWLVTLASMAGVHMPQAARRYAAGCPRCRATPCACRRRTQNLERK